MIAAYYCLHYGADYLGWSIKSIYDQVDKIYVLYSEHPSHGHGTSLPCPDSRQAMRDSAYLFGDSQNKIEWIDGEWRGEGVHRHGVDRLVARDDVDKLLVVDADEIWDAALLTETLATVGGCRQNMIRMLTYWRSFKWTCEDEMMPCRVICPKAPVGVNYLGGRVHHFGYARRLIDIEYKMSIHGHKGEWRPEWLGRFKRWPAGGNDDLHPTCLNMWYAKPATSLPEFMLQHPYSNLEVIS